MKAIKDRLKLFKGRTLDTATINTLADSLEDAVMCEILYDFSIVHNETYKRVDSNHTDSDYQVVEYGQIEGKGYKTLDGALKAASRSNI